MKKCSYISLRNVRLTNSGGSVPSRLILFSFLKFKEGKSNNEINSTAIEFYGLTTIQHVSQVEGYKAQISFKSVTVLFVFGGTVLFLGLVVVWIG